MIIINIMMFQLRQSDLNIANAGGQTKYIIVVHNAAGTIS
jgi:hypothetical protein